MLRYPAEHAFRLEDEVSGVPEVLPISEIRFGRFLVRFFLEGIDEEDTFRTLSAEFLSHTDIAEPGVGDRRIDADDRELIRIFGNRFHSQSERRDERLTILDGMVGRDRRDGRTGESGCKERRDEADGRACALLRRFEEESVLGDIRKQRQDAFTIFHSARNEDPIGRHDRFRPVVGLFEERLVRDERLELFRRVFARQWPQARSGSAGHDDDSEVFVSCFHKWG